MACLANVGIADIIIDATKSPPMATFDDSESATVAKWNASPPPPHNHPVDVSPDLVAAWDDWGVKNARLEGLAPPPLNGADPWAALRTRWTLELAAALAKAQALGAPA